MILNKVSEEMFLQIQDTLEKQEQLDFTALLCNEIRVPFDSATKTFYVPLDMEKSQWETMNFVSGQAQYQIMFMENVTDYDKAEVIAENQQFSLIVHDDCFWSEYHVVFTGLPIIDLATEEGFWAEKIWGNATFYDTDFLIHGVKRSDYNGHIRGNTSRMFPKKGYKLNLTEKDANGDNVLNKQQIFGMREDDDWILHALYNDDTKIRDALSMQVWDQIGAKTEDMSEKAYNGPRMTYVEVFADNVYHGMYALMEPVDAKQLDLSEEDYVYKRKNSGGLNFETFDAATDPYEILNGFEIKEGIMNESAWKPIARLAQVTYTSDEAYDYYILDTMDRESAIRLWLFMQIITGHDHTAKNVYYIAKKQEEGYKFYFAPWDMDLTWGSVSVGENNQWYTDFEYETVDNRVKWDTADRLIENNFHNAKDDMQSLYGQLRKTTLTDAVIEEMIMNLDSYVRDSGGFARDQQRWEEGTHANSCQVLLEYALERLDFLDKALYNFEYFDD